MPCELSFPGKAEARDPGASYWLGLDPPKYAKSYFKVEQFQRGALTV
jgi:hypothetical protein